MTRNQARLIKKKSLRENGKVSLRTQNRSFEGKPVLSSSSDLEEFRNERSSKMSERTHTSHQTFQRKDSFQERSRRPSTASSCGTPVKFSYESPSSQNFANRKSKRIEENPEFD